MQALEIVDFALLVLEILEASLGPQCDIDTEDEHDQLGNKPEFTTRSHTCQHRDALLDKHGRQSTLVRFEWWQRLWSREKSTQCLAKAIELRSVVINLCRYADQAIG